MSRRKHKIVFECIFWILVAALIVSCFAAIDAHGLMGGLGKPPAGATHVPAPEDGDSGEKCPKC